MYAIEIRLGGVQHQNLLFMGTPNSMDIIWVKRVPGFNPDIGIYPLTQLFNSYYLFTPYIKTTDEQIQVHALEHCICQSPLYWLPAPKYLSVIFHYWLIILKGMVHSDDFRVGKLERSCPGVKWVGIIVIASSCRR